MNSEATTRATFRDVFLVTEFRALWLAQVLSVTGDQLARVALTVLVYDRTRSALLAAVTFAASVVPTFIGGLMLSGLADRRPRRQVMIGAEAASGTLVAAMALPGVPLAALVGLLFAVTMIGAVFLAARSAIYPEILTGGRYVLGTAVTLTTVMFAQVAGFAAGGLIAAWAGTRVCLLADAATFVASALIIRIWVRARPAPGASPPRPAAARPASPDPEARPGAVAGLRLVFGRPAMRTPMLFGWLCAFYELPQGVATPLAARAGGGTVAAGLILAAQALGSAIGSVGFSRLASAAQRAKWTGPLAIAACGSLALFAAGPGLPAALLILAGSGLFACYQLAANAAFVQAAPAARRSQAFGIAQGGMSLGQGITIALAGVAAEHAAPASVIAAAGGIGAACALALTLTCRARPAGPRYRARLRYMVGRAGGSSGGSGCSGDSRGYRWLRTRVPSGRGYVPCVCWLHSHKKSWRSDRG